MFKDWIITLYFLWRRGTSVRVTADQVLARGKGYFVSAHLSSDGVGAAAALIYDGENTNEDPLLDLCAVSGGNDSFAPSMPIPYRKGLYVDVGSNVKSVTVHFIPLKE